MIATARGPSSHLTRHFFQQLFDFGVLSETGAGSFVRMLAVMCGVFVATGLLLTRIFLMKYASLSRLDDPEPYRVALLGDHAFVIALPMWIVAFVAVLAGHALFPDETDFRVLMALPVTRRLVFGTKIIALALFTGMFVVAAHVALAPLFVLTAMGRWAEGALALQGTAFVAASLLASAFTVLAVVAVHGLLVLFAPRRRLLTASAMLRSAMLCALVISLPLLGRLPAHGHSIADAAAWIYAAPPVWFVGMARWLLGDHRSAFGTLSLIAASGVMLAGVTAICTYAVLYRRFDRVMRPPALGHDPWLRRRRRTGRTRHHPINAIERGIRMFTVATLRRSVLHQGVVAALSSLGAGLVLNRLLSAELATWWVRGEAGERLVDAVRWAPFALIFVGALAVRASLALPMELRANWIFRLTDQENIRGRQLEAAAQIVRLLGVIVPVLLMLPLQGLVLGTVAVPSAMVAVLLGLLFVEILMKDWARIPFTCSYIPGKGFLPKMALLGMGSFLLFTTTGTLLATVSSRGLPSTAAVCGVVGVLMLAMRRRRMARSTFVTLTFEDELPTELHPLRLSTD